MDEMNTRHQEQSVNWQLINNIDADIIEQNLFDRCVLTFFVDVDPPKVLEPISILCDLNTLKRTLREQLDTIQTVFVKAVEY